MTADIRGKNWGKASVFNRDRKPMFGNGLITIEGDDWVRHRHIITPAFSPANLKAMASVMAESAAGMVRRWGEMINSGDGEAEIDVEKEMIRTAGEIIARSSFGISYDNGKQVLEKLRSLQITLFKSNRRFVGVPFGKFLNPVQARRAKNLGKEIDRLLYKIIEDRRAGAGGPPAAGKDLLGLLVAPENQKTALTTAELVDECKTFFFGGHETTALALSWTLLMLAVHPDWQVQLREEIAHVIGDSEVIDATMVSGLKKMGCVMNEVLRLYCPAPNVQRQARHDIKVGDLVIPDGTNIWIDVVSMHHDRDLWGEDVHEFKPERFENDILYGGCNHKMGFLPFGFGGRMCIGRNLTNLEYRVVLTSILSKFSFSLSPKYRHSPSIMLSLRPQLGLPLVFRPLV
ncbi:cytokinin hydroxylase-like [Andrographis paniculata]|uniref:cytokinin hydroxylase-like n=1 Tax=Andrographis paniculata TaxID=175694 RepID=UPI0021E8D7F3|nr:cytokinin hydroxylase-like [Andrographis paniculata]